MELRSKFCFTREELTKFVNDNNITKDQIQSINIVEEKRFIIFYWYVNQNNLING